MALDPRLHAYRPDLAASALRGRVESTRFVEGRPARVARGLAELRRRPEAVAPLDTQLLFGEAVTVYEEAGGADGGWAWVQNATDDYVGYVRSDSLAETAPEAPSHYLKVLRSFVYPEPDLKTPPLEAISFMSPLSVLGTRDRYSEVARPGAEPGWVYSAHLAEAGETLPDYVATALMFLGVPYLWGGRSSLGLDCSALIQLCLARAGLACPRDTYVQETGIGEPVAWEDGAAGDGAPPLRRGDLVFFPGHVAIALGAAEVLHANAGAMLTVTEPLADLVARVEAESGGRGITGVRRLGL